MCAWRSIFRWNLSSNCSVRSSAFLFSACVKVRSVMDLDYGPEYDVFRTQVRAFIEAHSHLAPPSADRAARPSSKAVEWQKLLLEHGYAARTRSEEHTSELQSLMSISYAVFCLKKKQHKCI